MALGALAGDYVVRRKAAAYLPARSAKEFIDQGRLHLVPDAPKFPYPIWAVWRIDVEPVLAAAASVLLKNVAKQVEILSDAVVQNLAEISEDHEIGDLGEGQPNL
ncbi:hypothetical protein [Pseudaestuariivita atlantica]|jgi:DNA-binding transcriptional LysR family regulator|uniref:hypothetical protein n=1 Tax=Pseudaestuariivita atlantica TaxID=1317121 RepID=UPI002687D31B